MESPQDSVFLRFSHAEHKTWQLTPCYYHNPQYMFIVREFIIVRIEYKREHCCFCFPKTVYLFATSIIGEILSCLRKMVRYVEKEFNYFSILIILKATNNGINFAPSFHRQWNAAWHFAPPPHENNEISVFEDFITLNQLLGNSITNKVSSSNYL